MNKKIKLLAIILALVLLMAGASVLYKNLGETYAPEQLAVAETEPVVETEPVAEAATEPAEESSTEPPRIAAPDVIVYDEEGNEVMLSDFFGKPIVLNFWASWCDPCKMEMPDFNEKSQELEGEVQFLMINVTDGARETVEIASAFIEKQGYTFPVFYDTAFSAIYTYGVFSYPTTYFIDQDGYAVAMANGAISAELLQKGIDMIYTS